MIRLILNPKTEPEIHLFNKSVIVIGAESLESDISLPKLNLQPIHLKIMEQDGFVTIINVANDPFASLNGHPFGKKLLKTGDLISLHEFEILFEFLQESSLLSSQKEEVHQLEAALIAEDQGHSSPSLLNISLPFEKEIEGFKDGEWQPADIQAVLKDIEIVQPPKVAAPLIPQPEPPKVEKEIRKQPASLKDDYLKELDDDNQKLSLGLEPTEQNHLYQAWKWIIFFIFSALTIAGIIGTVIYLTVSDNTEVQEVKVAQGMADIAIALTHAKIHHLRPHNQNWSDVDFIKTNLQTILPQIPSYASEIDSQGQFNCCSYSLRIYTSNDLTHFLLIAQPAPSLLHWLIPKAVILIDSQDMELRLIKDIKSLNRLLANPDPLEGFNSKDIQTLVKQGELIRLNSLAQEDRHHDFIPPKQLAWIRPGSENLIYNAPRYYRLGQPLIQKAIALSTLKGTSQEVKALREEIECFACLNNLVIYADQGKKSALLAKQGITTFAPSDKVLFGYLAFATQGKIHQAHLLKDEDEFKDGLSLVPPKEKETDLIAMQSPLEKGIKEEKFTRPEEPKFVDASHPIYIQLSSLSHAREQDLRPLANAIIELLKQEMHTPTHDFQERFQGLSHEYILVDNQHKEKAKQILSILYNQYEDMPTVQFIHFVQQTGFDQLIQQNEQSFTLADENCIQNLETMLTYIDKSKTLVELDNLTEIACSWLNFDHIRSPDELIKYQNLLRNKLLSQLEKLLLSYQQTPSLNAEEREVLEHVLNHERLIKPEEKEFFIEEFDRLLHRNKLLVDS